MRFLSAKIFDIYNKNAHRLNKGKLSVPLKIYIFQSKYKKFQCGSVRFLSLIYNYELITAGD